MERHHKLAANGVDVNPDDARHSPPSNAADLDLVLISNLRQRLPPGALVGEQPIPMNAFSLEGTVWLE